MWGRKQIRGEEGTHVVTLEIDARVGIHRVTEEELEGPSAEWWCQGAERLGRPRQVDAEQGLDLWDSGGGHGFLQN